MAIEVQRAVYRTISTWLKQTPTTWPRHHLVRADGRCFSRYLPQQA